MSKQKHTILITGASGYLGSLLVRALEKESHHELILTDVSPPEGRSSEQSVFIQANLTEAKEVEQLFTGPKGIPDTIYCLHGIMSRGAEDNFDLGMKINFDSVRNLLEVSRKHRSSKLVKFVFTSSLAVYGGPLPEVVTPSTVATPQGTYGVAKLMSEVLINEYTRRDYVDARILRLPTVIIRPGAPAAAASSFISGIIREPMNNKQAICPIGNDISSPELDLPLWLTSAATVIKNLVYANEIEASRFTAHSRVVCLPGFTATVREELEALRVVGGEPALDLVKFEDDPGLGFVVDEEGIEGVVRRYHEDLHRSD